MIFQVKWRNFSVIQISYLKRYRAIIFDGCALPRNVQIEQSKDLKIFYSLHEKCPNTEFFLVRIFLYSSECRKIRTRKKSECRKIQTRKNSVFGHFSRSYCYYERFFSPKEFKTIYVFEIVAGLFHIWLNRK